MARAAADGGGELAIQMSATSPGDSAAAGDEFGSKESASARPEKSVNCFVHVVALGEWVGNAFGALAFLWATAVLLGGFCTLLKPEDFWFARVMIFMEAFRCHKQRTGSGHCGYYVMEFMNAAGTYKRHPELDSRSNPQVWEPAMHIIAKLALDEDTRQEIGSIQLIISKLMHAFVGKDGENRYYGLSLRMAAGDALANFTMENTANCLAILKEPAYQLVKDLKELLRSDEYRCVVGSLLQNFCAHSRDELCHLGTRGHLSFALQVVMKNIISAEGKHLEVLIGLASHLYRVVPRRFDDELVAHTNQTGLVKKLVDTLNSNWKPSPEYPRMRRVIVCMATFMARCHGYASMFIEEGMIEALSMVQKTPSKVETYRVFLGHEGVVLERGLPLRDLAARAKEAIDSATSGQPCMINHH
ncbi:hypothetical protein ACP4OV_027620 [Aristida adscensionis]